MEKIYFEFPTQVLFRDPIDEVLQSYAGIAYQDYVICADCGCTFPIDEVEILNQYDWIDISKAIAGDELDDDERDE